MENSFSVTSAIGEGWKLFKANRGLMFKVTLIIGLLQIASAIFNVEHVETSGDVVSVLVSLIAGILGGIFTMGLLAITLHLVRGKPAKYQDIMPSWHTIWRFALVSIVTGVLVVLGFILLIIPGIYLMLRFCLARHVIVDSPEIGIFDAMRKSGELTRGVKWELLGLLLVLLVLNIFGALLLGIGLLITVPVSVLAISSVYVSLLEKRTVPVAPAA